MKPRHECDKWKSIQEKGAKNTIIFEDAWWCDGENKWWLDVHSSHEDYSVPIEFCPFCGLKLEIPKSE